MSTQKLVDLLAIKIESAKLEIESLKTKKELATTSAGKIYFDKQICKINGEVSAYFDCMEMIVSNSNYSIFKEA